MAGKLNRLSGRMVLVLLMIHAVLLPALYLGVSEVVESSQADIFVDNTRIYIRVIADILEGDSEETDGGILRHLDSAILGGNAIFATLRIGDKLLVSSLMNPADTDAFKEDFAFGEHADDVYYLSVPFVLRESEAILRLGFDEIPTVENISKIKLTVIYILLAYLVISLVLVIALGALLVRPIQRLQRVSREIASGDYTRKLEDKSKLYEIRQLAADLETMRSNLVGANSRLQQEISEREAAETEQKSLEARLRHSHRLESIGTLAGGIAHEFNNVLAPILLYTDLALEDLAKDSAALPKLERVMDLAQRAKKLSQQILSFGSRDNDAERVAVDIAPVVEEGLSLVRALVPATVNIRADLKPDLGLVVCDPSQIQQLVVNLCSNAFRSISKVGGHIQVSVNKVWIDAAFAARHPKLRPGNYAVIGVSDTGAGMDAVTMERIFEPFFTTQDAGKGTGLGLSVVHGIVAQHDGDIIVSSTLGMGSSFLVYLPIVAGPPADNEQGSEA